jgi:hypothetical protein
MIEWHVHYKELKLEFRSYYWVLRGGFGISFPWKANLSKFNR